MNLVAKYLSWDSEFFKFPIVRMELGNVNKASLIQAIEEYVTNKDVKLIYLFVKPNDRKSILAIQHVGAHLVDNKITYIMPLMPTSSVNKSRNNSIVFATKFTAQLELLAWQSGEYSRFRLDTKFPAIAFKNLYSQWLRNSLDSTIAQSVLVFQQDGKDVGLLTLGEKNDRADIGLLAVDESVRGQRIGQQLISEVQRIASSKNYKELQVVTQKENSLACQFYEKCGFEILQEELIYHLWVK